jgi:hypothetical protein
MYPPSNYYKQAVYEFGNRNKACPVFRKEKVRRQPSYLPFVVDHGVKPLRPGIQTQEQEG